jgi:hypothetical protein
VDITNGSGRIESFEDRKGAKHGIVFLKEGESLSIAGGDPREPLRYDRRELVDPGDENIDSAFYWVTSFGRLCSKRDYVTPGMAAPLIRIEHGTLGALPPEGVWSFANAKDVAGSEYLTAVASGVVWTLASTSDVFSVNFSSGVALKFKVEGKSVEIGNYPEEDALMKTQHYPRPGDTDPHFELYDDFFVKKHVGSFHTPKYVRNSGQLRPTGPSCTPGTLP